MQSLALQEMQVLKMNMASSAHCCVVRQLIEVSHSTAKSRRTEESVKARVASAAMFAVYRVFRRAAHQLPLSYGATNLDLQTFTHEILNLNVPMIPMTSYFN